ncbi:hypothetical protein Poli38472_012853 [Pythium oligandrum]|uniref:Uncharacterized protein n=1 Tax=Pythium oligandrum TaxID=41045 RepID=A0A8K1FIV1_PYTOL|nr:hypothetical protein Poli38472_012853 [Pythium oligandrum]|eukprot:TMW64231.1 hypothetical protein Poli38472_012853 [Pythium oligandrum]
MDAAMDAAMDALDVVNDAMGKIVMAKRMAHTLAAAAASVESDLEAAAPKTALETTLTVATSAANLVLLPTIVAGKAAYSATAFAVTAPIKVTKHVADSISGSWRERSTSNESSDTVDLFDDVALQPVTLHRSEDEIKIESYQVLSTKGSPVKDDAVPEVVDGVLFTRQEALGSGEDDAMTNETEEEEKKEEKEENTPGMISQLLFLPVRLVSTGVSTAVALPKSALEYSGKQLSNAVSSSQSMASSALVSSTKLVTRTSFHVAHGALTTANTVTGTVTGLVGASVRTVNYVIPPAVSSALWQGLTRTGSASTSVISYAIAVPAYRMVQALVPQIGGVVTEEQCVDVTKSGVKFLIKVLGPHKAFHFLQFTYETINSEEVHDTFLLCQDILRESLDAENYKAAGDSVGQATAGLKAVKPIVKTLGRMIPSMSELVDIASLVGEVAAVAVGPLATFMEEEETEPEPSDDDDDDRFVLVEEDEAAEHVEVSASNGEVVFDDCVFSGAADTTDDTADESEPEAEGFNLEDNLAELPALWDAGLSFLGTVCDSEEATSLFNTFGDFVDVLVQ